MAKQQRRWVEEEVIFLKNNYGLRDCEIAKILDRTIDSVNHKLSRLELISKQDNPRFGWKKEEIDFLKQNYLTMKYKDMAKQLNCTAGSVFAKMRKLGIRKPIELRVLRGKDNPMFGRRGLQGEANGMFGKHHSIENKLRISLMNKGENNPAFWRKGKTYEEIFGVEKAMRIRNNMSKSHKGKHMGEKNPNFDKKGELNPFYGRKHTPVSIEKVRSSWYHQNLQMANNPNWRGGLSFVPYSLEWTKRLREIIRERDNYICQICGQKPNEALDVHHIDYNKKNCNSNNLISLCKECHLSTNKNRDYWKERLLAITKTKKDLILTMPLIEVKNQKV